MEKKRSKKKIVGITFISIIACVIIGGISYAYYFFFGAKDYTFYLSEDMGEIHSVVIITQAEEDEQGPYDSNEYILYDTEVMKEIINALEPVKIKPTFTLNSSDNYKGISLNLREDGTKELYFNTTDWGDCYEVWIGMDDNGALGEGPKEWIGHATISKEDGDRLYKLINQILEDKIVNITIDDVKKMAEENNKNLTQYLKYFYTEEDTTDIRMWDMVSLDYVYKFPIEGTEGYLQVWAYNGIVDGKEGRRIVREVADAIVYNENGEEMNLYEEGINEFMEGLR